MLTSGILGLEAQQTGCLASLELLTPQLPIKQTDGPSWPPKILKDVISSLDLEDPLLRV